MFCNDILNNTPITTQLQVYGSGETMKCSYIPTTSSYQANTTWDNLFEVPNLAQVDEMYMKAHTVAAGLRVIKTTVS